MPLVNRVVAAVLRSPAAGLLKGVCLLTYVGPRTGRFVRLPVQFARDDDCLVVLPARSTQKTWWRSFGEPRPVDVLLGGVLRAGVARTVLHTDPGRSEAEGRYRTGHPKADLSHDPLVVIRLEPLGPASPQGVVAGHPVASFVVLAYLLSWLCWLPLLADRQNWVSWSVSPYLHLVGGLGPAAAAVLVVGQVQGHAGVIGLLRRCALWRGRLGWLVAAAVGPMALFGVALVGAKAVDGRWPGIDQFGSSAEFSALPIAVYWVANLLFYGFGEEIGWRGFLQPRLQQRRSGLKAAAWVAIVWAAWHLPLFGITPSYRAMPVIGFVGFFFSMLVAAFLLAALYQVSRGSILVVAVFHAAFDIATTTPSTATMLPSLMGGAVTVLGLLVIPYLARSHAAT